MFTVLYTIYTTTLTYFVGTGVNCTVPEQLYKPALLYHPILQVQLPVNLPPEVAGPPPGLLGHGGWVRRVPPVLESTCTVIKVSVVTCSTCVYVQVPSVLY